MSERRSFRITVPVSALAYASVGHFVDGAIEALLTDIKERGEIPNMETFIVRIESVVTDTERFIITAGVTTEDKDA